MDRVCEQQDMEEDGFVALAALRILQRLEW
jgi:hypothetical protein